MGATVREQIVRACALVRTQRVPELGALAALRDREHAQSVARERRVRALEARRPLDARDGASVGRRDLARLESRVLHREKARDERGGDRVHEGAREQLARPSSRILDTRGAVGQIKPGRGAADTPRAVLRATSFCRANLRSVEPLARALLWSTALLLCGALAASWAWRAHRQRRIGRVVHEVRARRKVRVAVLAGCAGGGAVLLLAGPWNSAAFAVVALSTLLLASNPSFRDSIYGERGVQRGWHARRFEELEAWRLIGDHLRWKLAGEWVSTDVPSAMQTELRARLVQLVPERESGHGNRGLDPQRASSSTVQSSAGA
jgi:hypothetical protein